MRGCPLGDPGPPLALNECPTRNYVVVEGWLIHGDRG